MQSKHVLNAGEIVGELAYALQHRKAATLRCVSDTALLSFDPGRLERFLSEVDERNRESIEEFLLACVIRYVCQSVPFLVGTDYTDPLHVHREPEWRLIRGAGLFDISWEKNEVISMNSAFLHRMACIFSWPGRLQKKTQQAMSFRERSAVAIRGFFGKNREPRSGVLSSWRYTCSTYQCRNNL